MILDHVELHSLSLNEALEALFGAQRVERFLAAVLVDPGDVGLGAHAAGEAREDRVDRVLVDQVARGGVPGLDDPVLHAFVDLKRGDQNARPEGFDLDPSGGQFVDVVGKAFEEVDIEGRAFGNGGRNLPGDILRGRGQRRGQQGGKQRPAFECLQHRGFISPVVRRLGALGLVGGRPAEAPQGIVVTMTEP